MYRHRLFIKNGLTPTGVCKKKLLRLAKKIVSTVSILKSSLMHRFSNLFLFFTTLNALLTIIDSFQCTWLDLDNLHIPKTVSLFLLIFM